MNLNFQRSADRILGTLICRIFSFFYGKNRVVRINIRPERILIILLSEMGSLVLASPMFEHIKRKHPDAEIHLLLFEKNRELLEILNVIHPANIHSINERSLLTFISSSLYTIRSMYKTRFDVVIDCELFARISSIFSFLSTAKIRVGFYPYTQEGLFRGTFINKPVQYNPYHHISQQFITLVDAIGSAAVPTVKRRIAPKQLKAPLVFFEQQEISNMMKRFDSDFKHLTGKKLVLISPGGGALPIRAWPLEYYCYLSKELIAKGYAVGIIGLKTDTSLSSTIMNHCQDRACIDLTGYTTFIRELMIMFHFASLLITNDGGAGHFAAMTPIPSIIFFGPETPDLYKPLNNRSIIYYSSLSCSPCLTAYNHRNSPCDGHNTCLRSIKPDQVLKQALQIMENSDKTILENSHAKQWHLQA